MKTYKLKALWPLLQFEVSAPPLRATLDVYGGELVKYAVDHEGLWLFALAQPLLDHVSEGLTGFNHAELIAKKIDGVAGYFYGMEDGSPLLSIPFTADKLAEFETRTAGFVSGCIDRGRDTDAWIADLEKTNPDAAELARGIRDGKWPQDSDTNRAMIQSDLAVTVDNTTPEAPAQRLSASSTAELDAIAPIKWELSPPPRMQGYGRPLYALLRAASIAGKPCPKARDVLDEWAVKAPPEVLEVMADGLKYYSAKGNVKAIDLEAIRKSIGRMVSYYRTTEPTGGRMSRIADE